MTPHFQRVGYNQQHLHYSQSVGLSVGHENPRTGKLYDMAKDKCGFNVFLRKALSEHQFLSICVFFFRCCTQSIQQLLAFFLAIHHDIIRDCVDEVPERPAQPVEAPDNQRIALPEVGECLRGPYAATQRARP